MRRSRQRVRNRRPPTTNVGGAAPEHVVLKRTPAEKMTDYDALPVAFRRELGRLPLPVNPGQVLEMLRLHGPVGAATWLRQQFPGFRPI